MAYYTALISQWALLTPGTTAQKLAQINAMTVTGSIPTSFYITGNQLLNCLDSAEFAALPPTQQSALLQICTVQGPILGGAASFVGGIFVNYYATKLAGPTIAALTALAKAVVAPWWQANGYMSPISAGDLAAAGGLA